MSKRRASNRLSLLVEPDERPQRRSRHLFADESQQERETNPTQPLVARPRGRPPGSKRSVQTQAAPRPHSPPPHPPRSSTITTLVQVVEQEVDSSNQRTEQDIVALVGPSQVNF